ELLKQMRKTTRYSIRKAEKDGVTIKVSTDPEDAKIIYHLQEATVGRHKFAPFPKKYFEAQLSHFGQNNDALLYWAEYQGEPIAAALIVFFGQTAVYHMGASSNEFRHLTASHLIQWEAICEAKRRGVWWYNFWGIIEEDNKKHPWYGLSLFKKGFGGEVVKFLHAQDKPVSWKYPAIYAFETLRRKKRGL
ncbi:MAG: peptidoglycan bridge formation glycyltransferase FemA/FemB family protein, partial [bacterium]